MTKYNILCLIIINKNFILYPLTLIIIIDCLPGDVQMAKHVREVTGVYKLCTD